MQKYFVTGIQLGGEAPHLGMVLTKGSLAGYSIQRNLLSQSNDRGCFLLHPDAMELAAGETVTLEWIIFRHEGKTDFFINKAVETQRIFLKSWHSIIRILWR